MYVRFVVDKHDEVSGRSMGIFMAMDELLENGSLYEYEKELEDELYKWFKKNLKVPKAQSSKSNYHSKPMAISWFKDTANEHIDKMRQYAEILEAHQISVTQIVTERPGNVVYEDKQQIAAIPFNDTFK